MKVVQQIAYQLVGQMNASQLTPANVAGCSAFLRDSAGEEHLTYSYEDGGAILGDRGCSLDRDGDGWLCWDEWGANCARISYNGRQWIVV